MCAHKSQIYTRDTRLPIIPPHAMASSAMRLDLESSGFCQSNTQKQMQNKCILHLLVPRTVLRVLRLHAHTAVHAGNTRT